MGKEPALLFMIIALVVPVNNSADSIVTVLNGELWGAPGSREESTRQDLLHLAAPSSITPEAAASVWKSLTTPRAGGPISFRVCGIRPARDVLVAGVASLVIGVVGLLRSLYLQH